MRYLIDGYNLLYALGYVGRRTDARGLDEGRTRMLDWLADRHGHTAGDVTVVFDAVRAPGRAPRVVGHAGLTVRYAVKEHADDHIETMLWLERDPRRLTVVSSDNRVRESARRRGCPTMTCPEYCDLLDRRPPADRPPPASAKPERPTPEETAHWLREFADLDRDPDVRRVLGRPYPEFGD